MVAYAAKAQPAKPMQRAKYRCSRSMQSKNNTQFVPTRLSHLFLTEIVASLTEKVTSLFTFLHRSLNRSTKQASGVPCFGCEAVLHSQNESAENPSKGRRRRNFNPYAQITDSCTWAAWRGLGRCPVAHAGGDRHSRRSFHQRERPTELDARRAGHRDLRFWRGATHPGLPPNQPDHSSGGCPVGSVSGAGVSQPHKRVGEHRSTVRCALVRCSAERRARAGIAQPDCRCATRPAAHARFVGLFSRSVPAAFA